MFFHIVLTTQCDQQCIYCFGEALEDMDSDFPSSVIDYRLPQKMSYDVAILDKFCRQDPDCVLTFYGGEPLLCIDDIRQIMDSVRAKNFLIQTNGLHLDRLEPEYVNRFHSILVSVDGDEALTDSFRGTGTFRKIVENLCLIKRSGFEGELIARMTVTEETDIFKQVRWLLENDRFSFSSVHWQLNAGFWEDFRRRDFERWSKESYNNGVRKLVRFWVDHMRDEGKVLRLYPFLGVAQSLLLNEKETMLRCGAGWVNYAIQTDGHIVPCPALWGMKDYYMGHISQSNPLKLRRLLVGEPCTQCDLFGICGGRCLYANIAQRWTERAYSLVCNTVRYLIVTIRKELPGIRKLVKNKQIGLEDFEYLKYNGCEIIP